MLGKLKYLFNPLYSRPQEKGDDESLMYSGFMQRLNAVVLDMIVFMITLYPIFYFISYITYGSQDLPTILAGVREQYPTYMTPSPEVIKQALVDNNFFMKFALNMFLGYLVMISVYIYFGYRYQATPGKLLLGYKIVDAKTHGPITLRQSVIRTVGYLFSIIPLGCGFIMINFTKNKQGIHDKLAGTVVLNMKTDFSRFEKLIQILKGFVFRKNLVK